MTELAIAKVEQTTNYGQFKYIESNREVSKKHVQALVSSFEANPALIATRPILVNTAMEVIDGQHRLQACQVLGYPVQYIVAAGLDIATAQLMNVLQKPWKMMDYARSYALAGKRPYQDFLKYLEEYPIALTPLMTFMEGGKTKRANANFREGKFEILVDVPTLDRQLGMLSDFATHLPQWNEYAFAMAFFSVTKIENYNHKRMLEQLGVRKIERQASRVQYLRELELIYNYGKAATSQVRFF